MGWGSRLKQMEKELSPNGNADFNTRLDSLDASMADIVPQLLMLEDFTDNFDRTNADTLGSSWTNVYGTFGIVSNRAVPKTKNANDTTMSVIDAGRPDITLSADFIYAGNSEVQSLQIRCDGTTANRIHLYTDGASIVLRKTISGASTVLGTYAYAFPIGTPTNVKINAKGNVFKVYLNSTEIINVTDDNSTKTLTKVAMSAYKVGVLCTSQFDNFTLIQDETSTGKSFISIGDSITEPGVYQEIIKKKLKFDSYVNTGISSQSIADGTQGGEGGVTDGISEDYSPHSLVTIALGTNDFRYSVPLGTLGVIGDTTFDRNTFYGAYRTLIEYILTQKPTIRIVLFTPMQRDKDSFNVNTTNTAGHKLIDYVNAIKSIGVMYGIPVCDMYSNSGFTSKTLATFTYDGLHPNALGYQRMGEYMSRFINNIGL